MIRVEGLTKVFPNPDGSEKTAVAHVSFQVSPGEIYGLLGPNGAGKTTTLRMISGLLQPTAGRIHINGTDVTDHPELVKRRIGYLTANTGLYIRLTPREMLEYFATLYGLPKRQAESAYRGAGGMAGDGGVSLAALRGAFDGAKAADEHRPGADRRPADPDHGRTHAGARRAQ